MGSLEVNIGLETQLRQAHLRLMLSTAKNNVKNLMVVSTGFMLADAIFTAQTQHLVQMISLKLTAISLGLSSVMKSQPLLVQEPQKLQRRLQVTRQRRQNHFFAPSDAPTTSKPTFAPSDAPTTSKPTFAPSVAPTTLKAT